MRVSIGPSNALASLIVAGLALVLAAADASAQSTVELPTDSADLVEEARGRQRAFERFRQSRIPPERGAREGGCDERIGRFCIWFGGAGEESYPLEPPETRQARRGLIGIFLEVNQRIADPWVVGQLVHYLVEEGDHALAEQVARECRIAEGWWCSALLGYSLHVRGAFIEAEAAFREAVADLPPEERERWTTPRFILSRDAEGDFGRLDPEARERRWELFWRLSDPLFLVEGNDRLTDHFARLVQLRNYEDADHPQGMFWEEDLEQTLLRYGRITGWSRTMQNPGFNPTGGFRLEDTRRVVGHHHPMSRGYLFPEAFLASPSDVPPESWITAPREARTWYAPPYAPDFRGLETQVGRFRRGDEMLVVGAYRPDPRERDAAGDVTVGGGLPDAPGSVETALFLVPEDGGEALRVDGADPSGVLTMRAEPGRYVGSLEVFDRRGGRAWRARQGVKQGPLVPGLVDVSDVLLLQRGAPLPASLDEALPNVRPGVRVGRDERFTIVWEVYGLRIQEPVRVTVGFTRGRPGFLAQVGEFLGVVEGERPVEITFDDAGPDVVQSVFRALAVELPDLAPGEYTLHLRLDLQGRDPVITSRPIVVEG